MNKLTKSPVVINTLPLEATTYFRTSDVTPEIEENTLTVYDGIGCSRSWGKSSVDSVAYLINNNIIAVHVTGWHKHTVSPVGGWFYFVREGNKWVRRTASKKEVKAVKNLLPAYGRFHSGMPENISRIH